MGVAEQGVDGAASRTSRHLPASIEGEATMSGDIMDRTGLDDGTAQAPMDQLRYLTAPLRDVARRHLDPGDHLLTAIYVEHDVRAMSHQTLGIAHETQARLPTRAFLLTLDRVLILEDPTDPATASADRDYLAASCPLDRIIAYEMRSHLLDCALTLVLATPEGNGEPARVTVAYNGAVEPVFLVALACIRAVVDGLPLPSYTKADETYARERTAALATWHQALTGLDMTQERAVERYLVAGERIQDCLAVPVIDESTWWERLSRTAHEHLRGVLARTDRQLLLVKETMRIIRSQATHGSDAWLMPLGHLRTARLVSSEHGRALQFRLEHAGTVDVVRLPLPDALHERALALAMQCLQQRDRD